MDVQAYLWPLVVLVCVLATLWTILRIIGTSRWLEVKLRLAASTTDVVLDKFNHRIEDLKIYTGAKLEGMLSADAGERIVENVNKLVIGLRNLEQQVEIIRTKQNADVAAGQRVTFSPETGMPIRTKT